MAISPSPPPPTQPAIAEYPRMVPIAIVAPVSKEVLASTKRTFMTICILLAPIERAASITPGSTSLIEDSTIRAIKGIAATTSGTTVAVDP